MRAFVTEYGLRNWVQQQNVVKSMALSIGDCIQRRHELAAMNAIDAGVEGGVDHSTAMSACYRWMKRFRRKWGVSMRKPGAREHVPLGAARKKVPASEPDRNERGRAGFLGALLFLISDSHGHVSGTRPCFSGFPLPHPPRKVTEGKKGAACEKMRAQNQARFPGAKSGPPILVV